MADMKSHAQAVVIGGGVVGCSVLYHLTKLGWKDVVLIERDELTSGSTWHAAGGMHTLNGNPNIARLQEYTIKLYQELEEISGLSCGIHMTGGVLLAGTEERVNWLKRTDAAGKYLGIETEMISVEEAARLFPLMDPKHFIGAMYEPIVGHVDPSGVTQAYAKSARIQGAEIYRHTKVESLEQTAEGWNVITDKGTIQADHVVNAGGLWAREVGRMVGLELPVLAMEHHYIVTDEMDEVKASEEEVIHCIDFEGEIYMRQEGQGMLMGTYERAATPWMEKDTPWDFGHELLENDIDRISPSLEVGFSHFPPFERAGIKDIINGPFTFAPDGNPLVGPVRGLPGYWCACAVMAGFSQGGGVGMSLANWMIHGDPGADIWAMDIARFGDYATMAYTNAKVRENYSRRFRISFPNEELEAARPLRTTPIYDRLKTNNAVFGAAFGLENALVFAPEGEEPVETLTFKRSNSHPWVAAECKAVRESVGMIEISTFAKYEITGDGAEQWLGTMLAGRMPAVGKMTLCPMLNPEGKMIGDFTLSQPEAGRWMIFGSGLAEEYHLRWFEQHLPETGVSIRSLRRELVGLSVAGPRARDLLAKVTDFDLGNDNFPFMGIAKVDLGMAPCTIGRVTFTGELGYEIYMSPDYQAYVFDLLMEAGEEFGLKLFGGRALNSLRLEKSFGSMATEYRPDYTPWECKMGRFIDRKREGWIGRDAALASREKGPDQVLVTLDIDTTEADCISDEPIYRGDEVVGFVTSGGYAHYTDKSLAMGYVKPDVSADGTELQVTIIDRTCAARVCAKPVHDPDAVRMRS